MGFRTPSVKQLDIKGTKGTNKEHNIHAVSF